MPISGLTDNQMVTETAAAASSLPLKSGQSNVTGSKCMTKNDALVRYAVDSGAMAAYADNQLPPSSVWIPISCSFTADFVDVATVPAPVCTDRVVVFQICNSNGIKDDNFDIFLNGVFIGKADLSTNTYTGSLFIADTDTAVNVTASDFVCALSGMVVYRFSPSLLRSYNLIEMRNTANNGANNFGILGFRNYLKTGNSLTSPVVISNLTYQGQSGINFSFNFEWSSCI